MPDETHEPRRPPTPAGEEMRGPDAPESQPRSPEALGEQGWAPGSQREPGPPQWGESPIKASYQQGYAHPEPGTGPPYPGGEPGYPGPPPQGGYPGEGYPPAPYGEQQGYPYPPYGQPPPWGWGRPGYPAGRTTDTSRGKVVPAIVTGGIALYLANLCAPLGLIASAVAMALSESAKRDLQKANLPPDPGVNGARILAVLALVFSLIGLLLIVLTLMFRQEYAQLIENLMSG